MTLPQITADQALHFLGRYMTDARVVEAGAVLEKAIAELRDAVEEKDLYIDRQARKLNTRPAGPQPDPVVAHVRIIANALEEHTTEIKRLRAEISTAITKLIV
jgi:hypothetical protein